MSMLELTDWTKTSRVKAQAKEIEKKYGVEPEPCTQTTRRLINIMIDTTIKKLCTAGLSVVLNEILISRTRLLLTLELMAGLRVGEATASGDLHGLDANSLCFLTPASPATKDELGTTVEVHVRDSKTGPGRYAAFVGTSIGPLKFKGGQYVKEWLRLAKIQVDTKLEGGFTVVTPNYWVASTGDVA